MTIKRHNFRDTRSDVCSCLCASETTKHYLTRCTNFSNERKILMDSISPTLMANHVPMVDNSSIVKCLLYGDVSLPPDSVILKATLKFMDDTERFVWLLPVLLFPWCTVYSPLPSPPIPFIFVNPKEYGYWSYHLLGQSIVLNLIFHSVFVCYVCIF